MCRKCAANVPGWYAGSVIETGKSRALAGCKQEFEIPSATSIRIDMHTVQSVAFDEISDVQAHKNVGIHA